MVIIDVSLQTTITLRVLFAKVHSNAINLSKYRTAYF